MLNNINVSITIDVENPQTPLFEKRFSDNRIWSEGYGVEKIIEVLDKYGVKGSFFTNVYEYPVWGKSEIERIVKSIHDKGHDVELHTHPIWIDDKRRENMFQFPLREQESIINWGVDFIGKCTGRKPTCHRAGAYGVNKDTLEACKKNDIKIDSSNFYGHPNCRFILAKNEPVYKHGILELPVTFFKRDNKIVKTDIDWMSIEEFQLLINKAKRGSKYTFINLFLHSYSLTKTEDNFLSFKPDYDTINKFEQCLEILQTDTNCAVTTLADCTKVFDSSDKELSENNKHSNVVVKGGKPEIVFVKLNPQIRIFKEALGIKKSGRFKLTLLAAHYDNTLFKDVFDRIIPFKDGNELARMVKGMNPYLFHAHAEPNTVPAIVIQNAQVPVIYDAYDYAGLRKGVENLSPQESAAERFCLENANGIVIKYPEETLNYYRKLGYCISAPIIHYSDYCAEEFMASVPDTIHKPEEWHIVYIGNIFPLSSGNRFKRAHFHDMAKNMDRQCIHFHLYPNPYQYRSQDFQCYVKLSQNLPHMHWHEPMHPLSISKEISKYHWGFYLPTHSNLMRESKFPYDVGNKITTYMEAGLQIVTHVYAYHVADITKQLGVGLVLEKWDQIENLRPHLEAAFLENRKTVKNARNLYSIKQNYSRLLEFYQRVCQEISYTNNIRDFHGRMNNSVSCTVS